MPAFRFPENLQFDGRKQENIDTISSTASERALARLNHVREQHDAEADKRRGRSGRIQEIQTRLQRRKIELHLNEQEQERVAPGRNPTKTIKRMNEKAGEYEEVTVSDDRFERERETIKADEQMLRDLQEQYGNGPKTYLKQIADRFSELPRGTRLHDRKLPTVPKPKQGQHEGDVAAEIRGKVEKLQEAVDLAWKAPQPFEDFFPAVEQAIRDQARASKPKFGGFAAGRTFDRHNHRVIASIAGARVGWPTLDYRQITGSPMDIQDGIGTLAWLFEDELVAKAKAQILADMAGGVKAISLTEKRVLIPQIQAKLWDHQQLLFEAVELAHACGKEAQHWPRVRTEIVLGVEPFTEDDFDCYPEPY
jgi:hypothetical protein